MWRPRNGLATASMVFGIISVAGVVTVLLSACVAPLAFIGVILGFVALRRPGGRGRAVAGIIMNGAVTLLSLVVALAGLIGLSLLGALFAALTGAIVSP